MTSTSCRAPSNAPAAATPCAASRRCVDAGAAVDLRVFATPPSRTRRWDPAPAGCCGWSSPSPVKAVERALDPRARLVLGNNPDGSLAALLDDCADAAVAVLAPAAGVDAGRVRARCATGWPTRWCRRRSTSSRRVEKVLAAAARGASSRCPTSRRPRRPTRSPTSARSCAGSLPGRLRHRHRAAHLTDLTRYLTAIGRRLDRLPRGVAADRERMRRVHAVQDAYDDLVGGAVAGPRRRRRCPRYRVADRGTAGQPVGPATRHCRGRSASSASTGRSTRCWPPATR